MATPTAIGRMPIPVVARSAMTRERTEDPSPKVTSSTHDTTSTTLPAASHFSCALRMPDEERHARICLQTKEHQARGK